MADDRLCLWVLAGSPLWAAGHAIDHLPPPDRVIAANGGSTLAARLGMVPNLVIGDLDSADPDLISEWAARGVEIRRYGHTTKLETDTELGVLAALEALQGREGTIYLLGGTGARLDHTLANVLLLAHPALAEVDLRVVEGRQEVWLAKAGRWNPVQGAAGGLVSLLPLTGEVTGVLLEGFLYPLQCETLFAGHGRGISNEIAEPGARLRFESGRLLVVVSGAADEGTD